MTNERTAPGKPLHLVIVSNTGPGNYVQGSDRDWVNLLNALGPDYVRVTWVGVDGAEALRAHIDKRILVRTVDIKHPCFYELTPDNVEIKRSNWLWTKIIAVSVLGLCRSLVQLRRALSNHRVDIVVSNSAVVLLGAVFALFARRPHIWNIKEYLDPQVTACRRYATIIKRFSSAVIAPAKVAAEIFNASAQVLPDGADIHYIKSHVQMTREETLHSLDLPLTLPVVAQVGRVCHRKGQHITAEAFVRLAARGGPPLCSLVFFGSGKAEELERLNLILAAAPADWRALVRFSTFAPDDYAPLAAADIIVHPSIFNDVFPNAVREAMILGKPVIASAIGGMPEMIVNNENGLLISPNNAETLAAALERLVLTPELRIQLGAKAEAWARKSFDIHLLKLAFVDLFDRVGSTSAST